jgi:hypothetical protein
MKILLATVVVLAAWVSSCNDGAEVVGIEKAESKNAKGKKSGKKGSSSGSEEGGLEIDDNENVINRAGFDKPGVTEDNGEGKAVEYPNMDFLGNGITTCKSDSLPTKVQFFSKLHTEKLELNMYQASIKADKDKAEDKANAKIAESTGITTFSRPTKEEKAKYVDDGFKWASYAIFAKSVTKERQGQTFEFSKPLPVFPWPAQASRFDELANGPKSWTAEVTGADTFTVTVTLSLDGVSGDEVRFKLQTEIHEDQPGNADHRARYEAFPIPREAIYTVNGVDRDVKMIQNISWFKGDECKGRPESVTMTYKLCRKSTSEKDEQFPCQ